MQPILTAALFDLDGTLVDSLRDIADSMNAVLKDSGFPTHPQDAYRLFVGDGMETLARRVLPREPDEETVQNTVAAMRQAYARRWQAHAEAYPGIDLMLSRLVDAGVEVGVMSNKPDSFTRAMVDHVFPAVPWAHIRGACEGVPVKPAPEGGVDLLRQWGRAADTVWYVGDTRTDIQFAKNTGMPSIGVTWGFRDRAELTEHGANRIVETPGALADLILSG